MADAAAPRQRRPRGSGKDPVIAARCSPVLVAALQQRLDEEGCTASTYVRRLLAEHLGMPEEGERRLTA